MSEHVFNFFNIKFFFDCKNKKKKIQVSLSLSLPFLLHFIVALSYHANPIYPLQEHSF